MGATLGPGGSVGQLAVSAVCRLHMYWSLQLILQLPPLYHTVTGLEEDIWFRNDGSGVIIAKDDYKLISKGLTLK